MADRDLVRDWVGSTPDDDTIDEVLARDDITSPALAALAILRQRRADIIGGYERFDIDGDASWTVAKAATLKALDSAIAALESDLDLGTGLARLHVAPICGPRGLR